METIPCRQAKINPTTPSTKVGSPIPIPTFASLLKPSDLESLIKFDGEAEGEEIDVIVLGIEVKAETSREVVIELGLIDDMVASEGREMVVMESETVSCWYFSGSSKQIHRSIHSLRASCLLAGVEYGPVVAA